ncbi:MAG: hypothetical protein RL030_2639 [Pseudomonadota bacterium]
MRSLWLLAGICLGAVLPPQLEPMLGLLAAVLVALAALAGRARPMLVLVAAAALARALVFAGLDLQQRCEERVLVQAQVSDVPSRSAGGWRFEARLHHPRQPGRADLRAMVELPGFGPGRPRAGETWQLLLRYQPISPDVSGGIDPLRLAVRDRRQASARALRSPLNRRLKSASASIDGLRERVAQRIQRRATDPAAGALLAALAVGVTGEVTTRQWRDFSATGITHLVAISGAHVTFFALLSMALMRKLWSGLPWLQRQVRRERLAGMAGLVLATGYALLSGFSVPAQRTLLMLGTFILWRETSRASSPCWSLAVAMCAVLALDPLAILGAGFWLSFGAVAAILLLPGSRLGEEGALRSGARVQIAVSLALLPLTVLLFGSFSFAGLLVNIVAIPLFGFVLVPGALLATLAYLLPGALPRAAGDLLVDCAGAVAAGLLPLLGRAAQWNAASWLGVLSLPQLALTAITAVCCLLPLRPTMRLAALALVLSGFAVTARSPEAGMAELAILGVGDETSVIVTTASHRLVFGTGEVHGGDGRRFRARVIDRLQRAGGPPVSMLVAGRPRAERLAAATAAAANWPGLLIHGDAPGQRLPPEFVDCAGRDWVWDGVAFGLDKPSTGRGCTLQIHAVDTSALLTLDVDEAGWQAILAQGALPDFVILPPAAQDILAATDIDVSIAPRRAWLLGQRQDSGAGRLRWARLREQALRANQHLLDAASTSGLQVRVGGPGPVVPRPLQTWRWGAWAGRLPAPVCGAPQSGQQ